LSPGREHAPAAGDPWGSLVAAHEGRVVEFDADRGLGAVVDADGRRYPFHCTAIADGTRTIRVGTAVRFAVAPGHGGRLEARDLVG
jgi:cold shock CspA family protein